MHKIQDENIRGYNSVHYWTFRVLGLLALCLMIALLWHLFVKPLWEAPDTWLYILGLIIFTYLMGLKAESTGSLNNLICFHILIFYTIGLIIWVIGIEMESIIIFGLGFGIFLLGMVVGLFGMKKLTNLNFFSEIPAIFQVASHLHHEEEGEFSSVPYKTKVGVYSLHDLRKYAKFLLKYGLALRKKETDDSITIYIRKPSFRTLLLPGAIYFGQSWIRIQSDGEIKISVSKEAYKYLDSPGPFEDFCEAIAHQIDESIKQYLNDDEQGALSELSASNR